MRLGIPQEKHTHDGLSACFPPELKVEEAYFDIDTLAEVLIHLVKSRIIKIDGPRA